jgi:hypothetical protein
VLAPNRLARSRQAASGTRAGLCAAAVLLLLATAPAYAATSPHPEQRLRSARPLSARPLSVSAPRHGRPAGWGERSDDEPIERYAALIDRLARRLEDVLLAAAKSETPSPPGNGPEASLPHACSRAKNTPPI